MQNSKIDQNKINLIESFKSYLEMVLSNYKNNNYKEETILKLHKVIKDYYSKMTNNLSDNDTDSDLEMNFSDIEFIDPSSDEDSNEKKEEKKEEKMEDMYNKSAIDRLNNFIEGKFDVEDVILYKKSDNYLSKINSYYHQSKLF